MSDLQRFTEAQKLDFDLALEEIRSGCKRSHWMWYIFPQIRGLGFSSMSAYYGTYLGGNLRTICQALLELDTDDPHRIFGSPDDLKLRSSMTLFEAAEGKGGIFTKVIEKYYGGRRDQKTIELLKKIAG